MFPLAREAEIFSGVLTRNESGAWFHCGFPVKFSMCSSCPDGCFVTHCADWDCGWNLPDCLDEVEEPLLNLAVV